MNKETFNLLLDEISEVMEMQERNEVEQEQNQRLIDSARLNGAICIA